MCLSSRSGERRKQEYNVWNKNSWTQNTEQELFSLIPIPILFDLLMDIYPLFSNKLNAFMNWETMKIKRSSIKN
jgi:hypothetical protein